VAVDGDAASLVRKLRRADELAAESKDGERPPRVGYVSGQVAQLAPRRTNDSRPVTTAAGRMSIVARAECV
jgi:hypothetical protein